MLYVKTGLCILPLYFSLIFIEKKTDRGVGKVLISKTQTLAGIRTRAFLRLEAMRWPRGSQGVNIFGNNTCIRTYVHIFTHMYIFLHIRTYFYNTI
jgi:hypothetical protein